MAAHQSLDETWAPEHAGLVVAMHRRRCLVACVILVSSIARCILNDLGTKEVSTEDFFKAVKIL